MRLVNVLTIIKKTIISAISDPPSLFFFFFFFLLFMCSCASGFERRSSCKQVRMVEFLFEDIFRVERLDPDGKKFDKGIYVPRRLFSFT
jgi:hypothetical protein